MFEAFRSSREQRALKGHREAAGGEDEPPPEVVEEEVTPAPPEEEHKPKPDWHRGVVESEDVHVFPLGQRTNVVFQLSYNALVVVIICVVLFGVLMACLGYALSSRPAPVAKSAETGKQPAGVGVISGKDDGDTKGASKGVVVTPTRKPRYRVRVLTVPNTPVRRAALMEDVEFLKSSGIKDVVHQDSRRGRSILLYAGAFTAEQRQAAEALAQQLKTMQFRGRYEFADARVVEVE